MAASSARGACNLFACAKTSRPQCTIPARIIAIDFHKSGRYTHLHIHRPQAPPSTAPHPLHHPALFRRMRASVRPGIPRATHARFVCRCAIKATSSEAEAAILCVLCVCVRVCGSCVYDKTRNRHDRIVCHKSGRTNTPKTNIPGAHKQCAKAAAERFGFECGHKLHTNTHIHIHNTTAVAWERACVRWINAAHRIHQRAHARARAAQEHKIAKWWLVSKPRAKLPTVYFNLRCAQFGWHIKEQQRRAGVVSVSASGVAG